jgi:multiple sugar transport system substrate-binding protein
MIGAALPKETSHADSHTFVLPRQSKVSPERRRHV